MKKKEIATVEQGQNEIEKMEDVVVENKRAGNTQVEKKQGVNKTLIITAIIMSAIAIAMVTFALVNKLNPNVYSNIYLNDIKVGGMTEQQVTDAVDKLDEKLKQKVVTIKYNGEDIIQLTPDSIDMSVDKQITVKNVMEYGRTENIVLNNIKILAAMFKKEQITPIYTYSEAKLTNISSEVTSSINERVQDDSFSLDEENYLLLITKGKSGKDIVVEEFKSDVIKLLQGDSITEYNLMLVEREPKALDIDVVYAQICREAKDAYADETIKPVVYHKHEMGISFDKEALRKVLNKDENQVEGKVIKFKLTTIKPKVTIQDITKNIYKDKLASYTSSFKDSDSNRASNIQLGAKLLNGTIVMPGETFSFNKVMGDCGLSSRGFKPAAVFKAGKVAQEVGGGICQIPSTLYVSVLYANLAIVSRSNHALPVYYVPTSLDATIYYPYLDFKFKNTRNYPIKIVATTNYRQLTISIYGTLEEKEYDIELTSWVTATIPSVVKKQNDSNLEVGKTKVIQSGTAGRKSVAYRTVKYKGKVITKELLSEDSYSSTPRIIAVGTKKVQQNTNKEENVGSSTQTPNDSTTGGEGTGNVTGNTTTNGTANDDSTVTTNPEVIPETTTDQENV